MIGSQIGGYEVLAKLGAGGMGEVYRARDKTLNRDVAIKVLPESFAADPDRLARFTREAQALAALNHPNIAQIYGAGVAEHAYIAMELVEGVDLSQLTRQPMPWTELVPIARQIAEALEAAHEHGIIHRDLKPANIKLRDDGTVKVLDFGLAKAMAPEGTPVSGEAMNSPTLTARATQLGMILGTAAYMAPEQAKGKVVDKRADIWAFGVVLYELLTARRAFDGDDVSTTLAAVLMKDPEWGALPAETPAPLAKLIRRCLERDPRQRLRDIGEARLLLSNADALREEARPTTNLPDSTRPAPRVVWIVAAAGIFTVAVFGWWWVSGGSEPVDEFRLEAAIAPPDKHNPGIGFALSPDGRRLAFEARNDDTGVVSLWIRDLASGTPTRLPGTEGGTNPFWSPAGTEIAFFADGRLRKTDLQGAPPQVICGAPSPRGGAWGQDGTIVFTGSFRTGLERVPATGGKPVPLTTLDAARNEKSHRWPSFLPGGTHIIFLVQTGEATAKDDASTIEALEIATGIRTRLVTANSSPIYSNGVLLFSREGALRGQAFDAHTLAVSGPVFSVASGVAFDMNEYAAASAAGQSLVYLTATGVGRSNLVIVDRSGRAVRTLAESLLVEGGVALSRDGSRVAAAVTAAGDTDIWLYDLARNTSGKVTFEQGNDVDPSWSADGTYIYYSSMRVNDGIVHRRLADGRGQAEKIAANQSGLFSPIVARDGTWLVVRSVTGPTSQDLFKWDVAGQKLSALVNAPANEDSAALSPDDRWLAYASDDSGRFEVYVRSLQADAGRWGVSTAGGFGPQWRADGRELYFTSPQGQLMAATIEAGPTFRASAPRELFRANFQLGRSKAFAPFPDGQRFVAVVLPERDRQLLTVVTNWDKK